MARKEPEQLRKLEKEILAAEARLSFIPKRNIEYWDRVYEIHELKKEYHEMYLKENKRK